MSEIRIAPAAEQSIRSHGAAAYPHECCGALLGEGDVFRFPELGDALERFGAEGSEPFYRGEVAAALSDWVIACSICRRNFQEANSNA